MNRHLHEPLKLPKHPQLLHEINQMSIRIKSWHLIKEGEGATAQQLDELRSHNSNPDWQEVVELLRKAYNAINEQREDPRRY
jgi:hypothetical protein